MLHIHPIFQKVFQHSFEEIFRHLNIWGCNSRYSCIVILSITRLFLSVVSIYEILERILLSITVLYIIPLTSSEVKHNLPTHVDIIGYGLSKPSIALCEQIVPLDKNRLLEKVGKINDQELQYSIQRAMMIQLNMAS